MSSPVVYPNGLLGGPGTGVDSYLQFGQAGQSKSSFTAQVIFVTLITVILFVLFVAGFYFGVAAKVESDVVETSVTGFVEGIAQDLKVLLPPAQAAAVGDLLHTTKLPDMVAEDQAVKASNKKLLTKTMVILGGVTVVILVVIFATYFGLRATAVKKAAALGGVAVRGVNYPDLAHIFRICAFTFLGVIAAEFLFLYGIAAQYKPLDPNKVKAAILQAVIRNINNLKSP